MTSASATERAREFQREDDPPDVCGRIGSARVGPRGDPLEKRLSDLADPGERRAESVPKNETCPLNLDLVDPSEISQWPMANRAGARNLTPRRNRPRTLAM